MKKDKSNLTGVKTFDELLDIKYGKRGTAKRNAFEEKAQAFYISEMLKEERKKANLTQSQLAERIGTKKSYISKIENCKSNITVETLIRIFEHGLNKKVHIIIK